jgi:hypothetical protein
MNLFPFAAAWAVLALIVAGLAFKRRSVSAHEDDTVHLSPGSAGVMAEQQELAKKLTVIDRWGKILTILLVVSGIVIAGLYLMQMWEASANAGLR